MANSSKKVLEAELKFKTTGEQATYETLKRMQSSVTSLNNSFKKFSETATDSLKSVQNTLTNTSKNFVNVNDLINKSMDNLDEIAKKIKKTVKVDEFKEKFNILGKAGINTEGFRKEFEDLLRIVNSTSDSIGEKLTNSYERLNVKVKSGILTQEQANKVLERYNSLLSRDGKRALDNASSGFDKIKSKIKSTAETMRDAGEKTKVLGGAFEGLGARIRTFAQYRVINAMTQAISNLGKAAVDLESAFANIQAITSASDAEMGKLRNTILRVGEASKYSVEEIAKATTMLGQAGLTADEINNVLETTTQLAAGTGSELSNTVDLMTSALAVWGLNSEEASHLSDVMVTGMNRTKATLETFRMAVQYAGATMASLNVSFDEFASVAAAASNAGLRASVVGTGLRAMTSELISPTKKMAAGLAQLGLSTEDVNIESQGLVNVLYKLKNAGLTAANAYDLFGKRAAQFVLAAQGQLDVVDELRVAFNESGATLKAYGTQMDTISAQATALGNTIKEMAANILDSISWMIKGALKGINKFLKDMIWLFSDKEKIKFEELKKKIDDSKLAVKTFYDFVKNLSERDYGKDTTKAMEDLNKIIDKINRKFKLNIEHVNSVDKLTDAYKDLLKVLKDVDKEQNEQKNEIRGKQKSYMLNEFSSFDFAKSTGLKLNDNTKNLFKNYRRLYLYRIEKSNGDIEDIADEIENERDLARKKLLQYSLEDAKRIYDTIGKKSETAYTSDELDKAIDELKTESETTSNNIKDFTESMNTRIKTLNEALYKTSKLSLEEVYKISDQAENARIELEKINDRSKEEWDKIFKDKGIINKEEQKQYQQKIKETKKKDIEKYINLLNDILNTAEEELKQKISTPITQAIVNRIEPQITALKDVNKTAWESYTSGLSTKSDRDNINYKTQREIEREKARQFNLKYQNLAIQQQADSYQADIEQARRKGMKSRYDQLDKTGTIGSAYSRYSADKERLEKFKTAYANQETLDKYMKDYGDLFKQVESGKVSLEDADNKSDKLISKMIELQKSTEEARAEFGDLNETNLEDVNEEIAELDEKMKQLDEDSKTTFGQMKTGFQDAVKKMVETYSYSNLGATIAQDLGNGVSDALYSIVDGTKSAKEAFSDMARSILQDISKMLIRMAVMKAMMAAFGGASGGEVTETGGVNSWSNVTLAEANGGFIPKLRAATGSMVRGGVQGKDSVPAMLMPGEYVLKKSAVDALGTNFLNDLNNNAAQTLTSTAANLMQAPTQQENNTEPSVVNVWVVSKEEEAKMGPSDVIATISKDIMTGGQTRRLIQQVVVGRK